MRSSILILVTASVLPGPGGLREASAQGTTAFVYQGRLETAAGPATGLHDFRCELYNASGPPDALVSTSLSFSAVGVTNGLFQLTLDFGPGAFNGQERWLNLQVRTNNGPSYATLAPRQRLTPAPYALFAARAADLSAGANPTFTGTPTFNAPAGPPFNVGNTTKIPNLNADLLDGLDSGDFVRKSGDTMTGRLTVNGSSVSAELNTATVSGLNVFPLALRLTANLPNSTGLYAQSDAASGIAIRGRSLDGLAGAFDGSVRMTLDSTLSRPHLSLEETQTGDFARLEFKTPGHPIWHLAAGGGDNRLNFFNAARGDVMTLAEDGALTVRGIGSEATLGFTSAFLGAPTAVRGEANGLLGTGLTGVSDAGTAIYGSSPGGFAGVFSGAVRIDGNSSHTKPFLQVHESEDGDYARIQLQVANRALWHISVGGPDNSLVFYNSANSIVSSVSETGVWTTRVLTITGGADIAEPFQISDKQLAKGSVVVIDEEQPGHLKLSSEAYDKRVAGIISGAGGVNPGLSLSQQGVVEGDQQVALSGRVYVQADASREMIKPGDLLTTSSTPGHAMKVADPARAQGAVLGKAMTGLKEGKGLVLVLVTLQ